MELIELPLYESFIQLMKLEKGQPNKGIDPESYLQLIHVLQQGYALNSKEELLFFCKKVWLKPFHNSSTPVNEAVLEKIILDNLQLYEVAAKAEIITPEPDVKENAADEKQDLPTDDIDRIDPDTETPKTIEKEKPVNQTDTTTLLLNIEEENSDSTVEQQDYSHYFNDKKFKFNYTYLTVSPRFIEQTVRSLRYKVRGTGRPVIDIEATVKDAGSKGYFDRWVMNEEDDFITRWTLLFDRGGSMLAFHGFQDTLATAAFNGTIRNRGDQFYFRNVAKDFLFLNIQRTRSLPLEELAEGPLRNILIVSDAGAARGSLREARIRDTFTMIHQLRKHRIAWLNPLPKARWKNTSAAVISEFVSMFETGNDYSDDLGNIVRLFKSKIISQIE